MRALLLTLALVSTVLAQSPPIATITVFDENGVAVASARVTVQANGPPALHCQTNFNGRCQFSNLPSGQYQIHVEKEGFYALDQSNVDLDPTSRIDVAISHQQEVREVVNVQESTPAIDPAQVSSQETLSGLDVINIVYPGTHDYRNALNFIPGVIQDQAGQPHVAGAQTYQTETLLDGFNVTQPANGQLLIRVSIDAFRSIQVEPSREPAEAGKGSAGLLALNTGIGDDHFRFWATDFIPSIQNKHGWRFDQFLPHFTFSGPIVKKKIWFYNAFEGEYDNLIYVALPVGHDNDHILRLGNLTKLQTNMTSRNILTTSFLINTLHDQYAFLSPQSPQLSNPKDLESAYAASIKDQHYFHGGMLLETGVGFNQYNIHLIPYGSNPYFINTTTTGGSYYLGDQTSASRFQGIVNLYLPSHEWLGRHDFKVGVDLNHIIYDAEFSRQPISFLTEDNPLTTPSLCVSATQTANFPCTRYSAFTAAGLHEEYNNEVSAYIQDRWSPINRVLIEPGLRFDWDSLVHRLNFAPRLAGTYALDNSATTKFSAGIGQIYESTPIFLIARPFAGSRVDTFYTLNPNCIPNCVAATGPVSTTFSANTNRLRTPVFLNWSVAVERKLPAAIYLKAEYMQRTGAHGFVYDARNGAISGDFVLQNTRHDQYRAFQVALRHNFRESYMISGSYTRSSAHSSQALDFNVDSNLLSRQLPGPYPWDTSNRFLSWGYIPFFTLPIIHQLEMAYSLETRTGFPFNEFTDQEQLIGTPGAHRFPTYFSLNVQLEKRFHLLGYYLALRGGFDNITGRCNPFYVDSVIDATHPAPTFAACQGRAFTSRIRLLGRK